MSRTQVLSIVSHLATLAVTFPAFAAPLGSSFTYQGDLKQNGQPVTGAVEMEFRLYGAQTGGTQLAIAVYDGVANPPVQVAGGVFAIDIDFGVLVFDGNERWLEIRVRYPASAGEFTTFPQRQRIAPAPYSTFSSQTRGLFVDASNQVGVGTDTPSQKLHVFDGNIIADAGANTGNVTRRLTLQGARSFGASSFAEIDFANHDQDVGLDYVGASIRARNNGADGSGDLRFHTNDGISLTERMRVDVDGNVGIGETNPSAKLDVAGTGKFQNVEAVQVGVGTGTPSEKLHVFDGNIVADAGANTSGVSRRLTLQGARASGASSFAEIDFANHDQDTGLDYVGASILAHNNSGADGSGDLRFRTNDGISLAERMRIDVGGNVGIGVTSPTTPFSLRGNGGSSAVGITQNQVAGIATMELTTADEFGNQASRVVLHGLSNMADIVFYTGRRGDETETMRIDSTGNVGIGETNPSAKLDVAGTGKFQNVEAVQLAADTGTFQNVEAVQLAADTGAANIPGLTLTSSGPGFGSGILLDNTAPGGKPWSFYSDQNGVLTVGDEDNQIAAMSIRYEAGNPITSVRVLEILGGSDLAESYDVAPVGDVAPMPGMVVSIDPREIGKLIVADQPYDHRVAGIISGAGDVKPGLLLGQPGTVADGELPVANAGRVWCLADAGSGGPIEAGDLLTTSSTPGHAMRAEQARAGGAIIGKAMSSLKSGRGLVLVLVSLQ